MWAWRLEVLGIVFFWSWFGRVLYGTGSWQNALIYLVISHVVTSPLHVQVSVLPLFLLSTLGDPVSY
jgi:delta8-fatty-acid desaturase